MRTKNSTPAPPFRVPPACPMLPSCLANPSISQSPHESLYPPQSTIPTQRATCTIHIIDIHIHTSHNNTQYIALGWHCSNVFYHAHSISTHLKTQTVHIKEHSVRRLPACITGHIPTQVVVSQPVSTRFGMPTMQSLRPQILASRVRVTRRSAGYYRRMYNGHERVQGL